ncbi:MAG TPA: ABC transporter permease [Hyphomicrobiaceae bacterium]|nr:ABC transporter permease [Hyphomicrobiaceae bacterium]
MSVQLDPQETVVAPSEGWISLNLREVWAHRDLVGFLVWRDVKVRYRQTFFGAAWAVVPPFFTMIVFTLIFGVLVKVPSDGQPYWAFSLCALTAWNYFSQAFTNISNSAINNSSLIEKVYFPRLSLPLAAALSPLLDLAIAFAFLVLALAVTGNMPSLRILLVFPLTLIALATALGFGSILAAINVRYRDVRHIVPLTLQLWLFATPVVYPATLVPESLRPFLGLNPMAGVVEGFRWALLDSSTDPWPLIGIASVCSVVVLIIGLLMFRRHERLFADLI